LTFAERHLGGARRPVCAMPLGPAVPAENAPSRARETLFHGLLAGAGQGAIAEGIDFPAADRLRSGFGPGMAIRRRPMWAKENDPLGERERAIPPNPEASQTPRPPRREDPGSIWGSAVVSGSGKLGKGLKNQWAGQGSNLRRPPCKGSALPLSYPPQCTAKS